MSDVRWKISRSAGVEVDAEVYRSVLDQHRDRVTATAKSVPEGRWGDASRCGSWSIHETFRHLADSIQLQASSFTGEAPFELDEGGDFDPNTTPDLWLQFSADETPAQTTDRFASYMNVGTTASVDALAAGLERRLDGPYGDAHWSAISCHVYWDSWIHQRDMAVPLGIEIAESTDGQKLAAMYGLLMAGVPAVRLGVAFEEVVRFETDNDPLVLKVVCSDEDLMVTELDADTPCEISGPIVEVVDALAGRGATIDEVLKGPSERVGGLGLLADFFRNGQT